MKIKIINGSRQYAQLFIGMGHTITQNLAEADLICFTGGADVTPSLYGDKAHQYTGNDVHRDKEEGEVYQFARKNNIPMVGICRGAQFLNVMSGGRMYQHVEKHTMPHEITDLQTGEVVYVTSTHHQMMMPSPDGLLVASSHLGGSREWFDGQIAKRDISKEDIEVVYYASSNCLCFQPHPEFDGYEAMKTYFKSLLSKYLNVQ